MPVSANAWEETKFEPEAQILRVMKKGMVGI